MNPSPIITRVRLGLPHSLNRRRPRTLSTRTRWNAAALALVILSIIAGALALANL